MYAKLAASILLPFLAAAAVKSNMLVSTDWLNQHRNDAKLVILHVAANRAVYDAGHIPGARFIPYAELVVTRDGIPNELPEVADLKRILEAAGVSTDSRIVIYSDVSVLHATRTYFTFDYLGLGDQTALLDGGLTKWQRENRPLTNEVTTTAQGKFTPHPKPELVARIDAVKQLASPSVLLDARPSTDYSGEKGAHIPGARNVYWMDGLTSREDQTLKPETILRDLYEGAGVTPDRPVVTYCMSGVQATQAYFTLKYLGYSVRLYDGSMSEWTANKAPVEK